MLRLQTKFSLTLILLLKTLFAKKCLEIKPNLLYINTIYLANQISFFTAISFSVFCGVEEKRPSRPPERAGTGPCPYSDCYQGVLHGEIASIPSFLQERRDGNAFCRRGGARHSPQGGSHQQRYLWHGTASR